MEIMNLSDLYDNSFLVRAIAIETLLEANTGFIREKYRITNSFLEEGDTCFFPGAKAPEPWASDWNGSKNLIIPFLENYARISGAIAVLDYTCDTPIGNKFEDLPFSVLDMLSLSDNEEDAEWDAEALEIILQRLELNKTDFFNIINTAEKRRGIIIGLNEKSAYFDWKEHERVEGVIVKFLGGIPLDYISGLALLGDVEKELFKSNVLKKAL